MINAIAIDDEPLALMVIENFGKRSQEIHLLKTFTKPQEGLKYLNNYPVDLVFLDIQMPSMTGTQLVKQLKQDVMVIFTTAYENFAIEGFNLNAVDYLLKPFSYERFVQSLDKAKKALRKDLGADPKKEQYITIRADYSLMRIELERIKYIEGLDDYIKIHLVDSKPVVTRFTMKSILGNLPAGLFIRVHRSFIVPTGKITAMKNKIVFLGDVQIPVGNSYESNLEGLF
jgi:DNA-binding LytR/AlgR family response regulator